MLGRDVLELQPCRKELKTERVSPAEPVWEDPAGDEPVPSRRAHSNTRNRPTYGDRTRHAGQPFEKDHAVSLPPLTQVQPGASKRVQRWCETQHTGEAVRRRKCGTAAWASRPSKVELASTQ
jgi:hypothetical protein